MRVLIAYPPLQGKGSPMLTQNRQFQWFSEPSYLFPCVPASAATLLASQGHDVHWVDAIAERRSAAWFERVVDDLQPELLVMETKAPVVRQHQAIAARLKARVPGMRVVLMGDHVTGLPHESLRGSEVDYALCGGDYDFALSKLVAHLSRGEPLGPGFVYRADGGELVDTGPFVQDGDLMSLPWVDRDLTKAHLYYEKWKLRLPFLWTMAGRDCPWGRCTFCSWTVNWPKFRTVTPEHLAAEMQMLVQRHGARHLFDDTGTLPAGAWLRRLCDEMIARKLPDEVVFDCNFRFDYLTVAHAARMKRAGFRKLLVGIESASDRTSAILDKGLRREQVLEGARIAADAGLQLHITLMVGYPWETREDAYETLSLARYLLHNGLADHLQATVVMPYPGTPLFELCVGHDWLRIPHDAWERFDMTEPACWLPDLDDTEAVRLAAQFYRLTLHPRYVARQLMRLRTLDDLDYLGRGVHAMWGHVRDFAGLRR